LGTRLGDPKRSISVFRFMGTLIIYFNEKRITTVSYRLHIIFLEVKISVEVIICLEFNICVQTVNLKSKASGFDMHEVEISQLIC
jgi:hypothetical protein